MTRSEVVAATIAELGAPAFWGFPDEDACVVRMNFTPAGARGGGEYSTAYYSADQVRALLADRAAPGLLDALIDLEAMAERYRPPGYPIPDAQKRARAAIAKAGIPIPGQGGS